MGLSDSRVQATIAVSDLRTARHFYEQQLGLVGGEEEEDGVLYTCGERTQVFIYLSAANAGRSPATLAGWSVDDLDQTIEELGSRGVTFEHYDQPGLKTDERGVFTARHLKAAWVKDPDGNTLAVTETIGSN